MVKNYKIDRLTNHILLALNPKSQFGLLDPNDNVLEDRIEWNSKSNRERKRGSSGNENEAAREITTFDWSVQYVDKAVVTRFRFRV